MWLSIYVVKRFCEGSVLCCQHVHENAKLYGCCLEQPFRRPLVGNHWPKEQLLQMGAEAQRGKGACLRQHSKPAPQDSTGVQSAPLFPMNVMESYKGSYKHMLCKMEGIKEAKHSILLIDQKSSSQTRHCHQKLFLEVKAPHGAERAECSGLALGGI